MNQTSELKIKRGSIGSIVSMAKNMEPQKRKYVSTGKPRVLFIIPEEDMPKWRARMISGEFQGHVFSDMSKHYDRHSSTIKRGYDRAIAKGWGAVVAKGGEV